MRCDGPRNRFQGNENEAEGGARVHQHTYKAFREKEGGAPCGIQRGTFSIIWEREGRCVIEFVGKSEREANCKSPESGTAGGRATSTGDSSPTTLNNGKDQVRGVGTCISEIDAGVQRSLTPPSPELQGCHPKTRFICSCGITQSVWLSVIKAASALLLAVHCLVAS